MGASPRHLLRSCLQQARPVGCQRGCYVQLEREATLWARSFMADAVANSLQLTSPPFPSAPICFARGADGGRKTRSIKIHFAVENYGIALAINSLHLQTASKGGAIRDGRGAK